MHHLLNGHKFGQTRKTEEDRGAWHDATQQLNNNKMNTEQDEVKNSFGFCHVPVMLQVIPTIINGPLQFSSLQICLVSKDIKRAMPVFLFTSRDNKCTGISLVSIRSSFNQDCSQSHIIILGYQFPFLTYKIWHNIFPGLHGTFSDLCLRNLPELVGYCWLP